MRYCPPNITIHDIWIGDGISTCFLETITSSIVALYILIFGFIQLIFYKRFSTRIGNIPSNKLYCFQVFCHVFLILFAGLDFVLRKTIYLREVYGYEILYLVSSVVAWLMVLLVLVVERCYQLPTSPSNGHGIVLLMTWFGAFMAENLAFLSMDTKKWWHHLSTTEDKLQFTLWLIRFIFTSLVFILGIKAPGIRQRNQLIHQVMINDEESATESTPVRESHSQGSTWRNFFKKIKLLLPYIWPKKSVMLQIRVVFCFILLIGGRMINFYVPIFSKKIVDALAEKIFAWDLILALVGLKILQGGGAFGGNGVLNVTRSFLWIKVSQYTKREIQIGLFEHLHGLSLRWHLSRKTGEVLRVMDRGTDSINGLLEYLIFDIFPTIADIIIAISYFTADFNAWFGLIIVVMMILYMGITITVTEWRTKFRRAMNETDNAQRTKAVDSLLNFETVKYFNAESYEVCCYKKCILKYQKCEWQSMASLNLMNFIQNFVNNAGLLTGSILAALMVSQGTKTVGDYILFVTYIIQVMAPLNWLGTLYRVIQDNFVKMENMFDLMDEPLEIKDVPNALELVPSNGKIEFKNVSFSYQPERQILKNISFEINAGETIGIVGPTGSGKTTLMRLLFRFFDVNDGVILFDGQDIKHVTQNSLRKHIGVVPQDTVLFNDSIEANIKYSKPDATLDEVKNAATMAEIHDQIMNFPDGFETVVGERGLKLSGGEKQRMAIARTLLKSPLVILLDEATSALDSTTEKHIQSALNNICVNRTTMVIAHRLSTITHADLILVLKDGEIVQRGKHEELLDDEEGLYAELWNQQSNVKSKTNFSATLESNRRSCSQP